MAFAADAFTRADATLLAGQTADTGGTWSAHPGVASGLGNAYHTGNKIRQDSATYDFVGLLSDSPSSAAYYVQAVVSTTSSPGSGGVAAVCARLHPTTYEDYELDYYDAAIAGSRAVRLVRRNTGAGTAVLGSYTLNLGASGSATLKLEVSGTAIKGYVDGIERISTTDSNISAANRVGVRFSDISFGISGPRLDDFTADYLGGGRAVLRHRPRSLYTR